MHLRPSSIAVAVTVVAAVWNTANNPAARADPGANSRWLPAVQGLLLDDLVPGLADLAIQKTDSPDPVTAGSLLDYTITVTNNGPDPARQVVVTDDLPAGLQFLSSDGNCAVDSSGDVVCLIGTLAAGAFRMITLTVLVSEGLSGQIVNMAGVTSFDTDPIPGNNAIAESTQVNPIGSTSADLALEKNASKLQIMPGDTFDYTLTVTNQGPGTASNVVLFDQLPQGLTLDSAPMGCSGTTVIVCGIGSIGIGGNTEVTVTVKSSRSVSGTLTNTAQVGSETTPDSSLTNNAAQVNVDVS